MFNISLSLLNSQSEHRNIKTYSLEVLHDPSVPVSLPSHPVQHWKYIVATFQKSEADAEQSVYDDGNVVLNTPDEAGK